jgi:hypothetical protein
MNEDPTDHTTMASTAAILAYTRIADELSRIADALERLNEAAICQNANGTECVLAVTMPGDLR